MAVALGGLHWAANAVTISRIGVHGMLMVFPPVAGKEGMMKRHIVRENIGDAWYEYIPLGKFVVSAATVCRGRPTFKYTRIEVAGVLERLGAGHTLEALIADSRGRLSREAIEEAAALAAKALARQVRLRAGTA